MAVAFTAEAGRRLARRGLAWWRLGPTRMGRRLGLGPCRLGRGLLELRRLGLGGWGWGWDPGWAIAAAAVPVGVAIASQPAYGGDPGCWVRRRVWTANGHYMGRRLVNVCY